MPEDVDDVEVLLREGHTRADGAAPMSTQQLTNAGKDDIVASGSIREDAKAILLIAAAIHRDSDADVILDDPVDDLVAEQRGIRR